MSRPSVSPLPPPSQDTIPLTVAGLCLDCSFVRDLRIRSCQRCGSEQSLPLSPILNRDRRVAA